jgi:hypothetical protein
MRLLWDMDGTLLDSGTAVPAAYVAAVRRLGGPPVTPEQVVETYPVGPPAVMLSYLTGRTLTESDLEVYYSELSHAVIPAYPGVTRTMARLRALGQPVAVFTGASKRAAAYLLPAAGIEPETRSPRPSRPATGSSGQPGCSAWPPLSSPTSATPRTTCGRPGRRARSASRWPGATSTTRASRPT